MKDIEKTKVGKFEPSENHGEFIHRGYYEKDDKKRVDKVNEIITRINSLNLLHGNVSTFKLSGFSLIPGKDNADGAVKSYKAEILEGGSVKVTAGEFPISSQLFEAIQSNKDFYIMVYAPQGVTLKGGDGEYTAVGEVKTKTGSAVIQCNLTVKSNEIIFNSFKQVITKGVTYANGISTIDFIDHTSFTNNQQIVLSVFKVSNKDKQITVSYEGNTYKVSSFKHYLGESVTDDQILSDIVATDFTVVTKSNGVYLTSYNIFGSIMYSLRFNPKDLSLYADKIR